MTAVLLSGELKRLSGWKTARHEQVRVTLTAATLLMTSSRSSLKSRTVDLRLVSAIRRGRAKQPETGRTVWGFSVRDGGVAQQPCPETAKRTRMSEAELASPSLRERLRQRVARPEKEYTFEAKTEEAAAAWAKRLRAAVEALLQSDAGDCVPLGRLPVCPCLISVLSARGLSAADANGLSDPFAVLLAGKRASATRAVPKTLCPVWKETHVFYLLPWQTVGVHVYDYDRFGRDDFIGCAVLDLAATLDYLGRLDGVVTGRARVTLPVFGGAGELLLSVRVCGFKTAVSVAASRGSAEAHFLAGYASAAGLFGFDKDAARAIASYESSLKVVEEHVYKPAALNNLAVALALDGQSERAAALFAQLDAVPVSSPLSSSTVARINRATALLRDGHDGGAGFELLQRLAGGGDAAAAALLGVLDAAGAHDWQQSWLRAAAERQHAVSAYLLAGAALSTSGQAEAMRWLRVAADGGHAEACFNLALLCLANDERRQAMRYLRTSCALGFARAGFVYFAQAYRAPPALQRLAVAARCLQRSAELGYPPALYHHGCLLVFGRTALDGQTLLCPDVAVEPARGLDLLRRAYALGELAAKNALALAYLSGCGVSRDVNVARRFFNELLDRGFELSTVKANLAVATALLS